MVFQPQRCKVHLLNSAPLRRATWVSGMQTGSITLPTRLDPSSVKTWRHWVSVEQEVTEHTTFDQRQSIPHFPLQRDALSRVYWMTLKKSSAYCKIVGCKVFFLFALFLKQLAKIKSCYSPLCGWRLLIRMAVMDFGRNTLHPVVTDSGCKLQRNYF